MRKKLKRGGLLLLVFLLQQYQVFAVPALQKSPFYILGTNITRGGADASYNQVGDTIKFYLNGTQISVYSPTPVAGDYPEVTDVQITNGNVVYMGEWGKVIGFEQMQVGNTLSALIGNDTMGEENYYAKPSLAITAAIMGNTTPQWSWSGLKVDYKAWKPPAPSGISVVETLVRTNPGVTPAEYEVKLSVTVAPGAHSVYGLENTTYVVKIWKEGEAEPEDPAIPLAVDTVQIKKVSVGASSYGAGAWTTSSGSVLFQNSGGATYFATDTLYHIKAAAYNSVYPTAGLPLTWIESSYTTGGGAGPVVIETPYALGPGISQFAFSVSPVNEVKINNVVLADASKTVSGFIQSLVANAAAAGRINTFGWWDDTNDRPVGYIITWAGVVPSYEEINGAPADGGVDLEMDRVYQMAIGEDVPLTFTISGTR